MLAIVALKILFMAVNALILGRFVGRRRAAQQALDRLPLAVARVLRWPLG